MKKRRLTRAPLSAAELDQVRGGGGINIPVPSIVEAKAAGAVDSAAPNFTYQKIAWEWTD